MASRSESELKSESESELESESGSGSGSVRIESLIPPPEAADRGRIRIHASAKSQLLYCGFRLPVTLAPGFRALQGPRVYGFLGF
jgi:hypothetical protein